ncbi:gp18.7 [Erwinia phage vB_EamP-L1]|uniref:Gp18.7 n=1 Tax=Erwinia phage vB_EamP-L1 TaxID=1051673 RepID=G0YQ87_9CAUD|nr:Rz-like spanin [Erwinia phage vB_EamP-L1]AEJ81514.1 gp18.7 [Erwinia phage vB_EamP-L1]
MSTSRKMTQSDFNSLRCPTSPGSIRVTLRPLKVLLIGLLMICVSITSACSSRSKPQANPQDLVVDASLMVKPNLTQSLLKKLSK